MDNGEYNTPVVQVESGRKSRRRHCNTPKTSKYTEDGKSDPDLDCYHHLDNRITGTKKRSLCQAMKLNYNDMKEFRRKLYLNESKIEQDKFLLQYMRISVPKRRSKVTQTVNFRKMSVAYFVPTGHGEVQVCSKTFQKITGTQRMRLLRVANAFLTTGAQPKERRGGKSAKQLEDIAVMGEMIKNDILKYKCRESHYSRNKCSRSYLPPELNLKIMYERFIENQKSISGKTCSLSKYKSVFYKQFNLGFGNPHEDTCSACKEFLIKIKNEKDLDIKNNIRTDYRLHKLRAKKFFSLLNDTEDEENVIKICFDCQQNQPLPKLSVGEVFYSRQAWLYNFCVMQHKPKMKQTKEDVEFYVWLENQSGRGANEIASALQHYLNKLEEVCLKEKRKNLKLELYSDSCSSQNKNFIMLAMLANFMASSKVFDKLSHIFPIRGHSFMPPDRVFGRVEKNYRRREVIVSPNEYYSILNKHGHVNEWGKDWCTYNMKAKAKDMIKAKLPFKISQTRIIHYNKVGSRIKNVEVSVQDAYSAAPITVEVKKKGVKSFSRFDCLQLPKTNMVSSKKKVDVENLLKFCDISDDPDAQAFYADVLMGCALEDVNMRRNYDDEEPVI